MRVLPLFLAIVLASAATVADSEQTSLPDVTLFLPRFSAPDAIGPNVTATINLGIWRTLRRKPWPANARNLDFGNGLIIWSDEELPEPAPRAATATLRRNADLDMVLWGSARAYGPDVIVQAFLLTRALDDPAAPSQALWTVRRGGRSLSLGLPRELYVLGSVSLRPELVARFRSASALRLCPTQTVDCSGPEVGPSMRALQHSGPWTELTTPDGRHGWVYLPELGSQPNEIVSFTGAMISYYRGDYDQAARLFAVVTRVSNANANVREDAACLRAAALARSGQSIADVIDSIRRVNPVSTYALQLAVMDALDHPATSSSRLRALAAELADRASLFEDDGNAWFQDAQSMLAAAAR